MAGNRQPLFVDETGRATTAARAHARVHQADAGTAPSGAPDLCAHPEARSEREVGAMGAVPATAGRTEAKTGRGRQRQEASRQPADAESEQDQDRAAD